MRKLSLSLLLFALHFLAWGKPVSPQEASWVAQSFLRSAQTKRSGVQSASGMELQLVYTAGQQVASRTKSTSENGSYYVFNNGENGGFVIVAGDDRARSVLGYSFEGTFRAESMPVQLKTWLGHYEAQIKMLADKPENEMKNLYNGARSGEHDGYSPVVEPLLGGIQWGQDAPFNDLCPIDPTYNTRTPAGCVATAAVQIMKYYQWPDRGAGSNRYRWEYGGGYLSADFDTEYDWGNMLDNYDTTFPTDEQSAAAALITYHFGIAINMEYSSSGSGATAQATAQALRNNFKYDRNLEYVDRTHYDEKEWADLLKAELDARRPVLYLGEGEGGGHAFVCDGYDSRDYFHINWGWNGLSDGYFQISALDPDVLGAGGGTGAYNYLQSVFTNIQPPSENSTHVAGIHMSKQMECKDEEIGRNAETAVNVGFYNYGLRDFSGDLGLALYDGNDELVGSVFSRHIDGLEEMVGGSKGRDFKPVQVPAEVPAGLYRMYAVHKEDGTERWVKMQAPVHVPDYVLVDVDADKIRFTQPEYASNVVVVSKPLLTSKLCAGAKATFELTVKNEGKEYYSVMGVRLFKVGDPSVNQFVSAKIVRVPEGATRTFSFRSDEVIRLEPGMYEAVAVYDPTNTQSYYLEAMTPEENMLEVYEVLENPDPAKLHMISFVSVTSADGSANIYEKEEVQVSGTVKNAGGYADATFAAFVLHPTDDEADSMDFFTPVEVSLESGETRELSFSKRLTLTPGSYRLAFAYLGDDDMWAMLSPFNPVRFEIKARPSSVDGVAGGELVCYVDVSGLHLASASELRAVRLFDVSGKQQGEWLLDGCTADIPLAGYTAGLYIIYVQTVDGNKTFKTMISD